jgi:hypothetical protein
MLIRGALLLALLLASAAQSQPAPEQRQIDAAKDEYQRSADEDASRDQHRVGDEPVVPPGVASSIATLHNQHEANEERRDADESGGRWDRVGRWMLNFSVSDVVTAALTCALVYVGVTQTRRLRETLVQMRESEERQLRAYVSIERGRLDYPQEVGNLTPTAKLIIKNFGQTPAYEVCFETFLGIFELPSSPEPPTLAGRRTQLTLGPGATTSVVVIYPVDPTDAWKRQIRQELAAVFVVGLITYRDAFGKARRTPFQLMQTGAHFGTDRLVACEDGNDAD